MLCVRSCPDWCIYIEGHKEKAPPRRAGGKPRTVSKLDRFDIDYALCMYCGICVEVCPFDALFWSPEYEYSEPRIADLLHDKTSWVSGWKPSPKRPSSKPAPTRRVRSDRRSPERRTRSAERRTRSAEHRASCRFRDHRCDHAGLCDPGCDDARTSCTPPCGWCSCCRAPRPSI